ncbi:MAG: hypothetical protein BWK72_04670 [Rhodoferax ferrireducens]|uniref:Uncharacterized protein n=1 Tax=Rhodoferax ferrireducens TaxID=192843 RepID=A0A1W9KX65_9BURK|nr:MAG: hypothetical protein BWK72_04670 [Rhodoferax ferrireducens]
MMLVLSLLIVSTLVLSFFSVDEVTAGLTQALSGTGALVGLGIMLVLVALLLVWKKHRAASRARHGGAPR